MAMPSVVIGFVPEKPCPARCSRFHALAVEIAVERVIFFARPPSLMRNARLPPNRLR
jgi:hypothetical protein